MSGKRNGLLIFTKAPSPGRTKTRLTSERGGFMTPEEAAQFYRACLLDVFDISFRALDELTAAAKQKGTGDSYDLFVSCSPASEQSILLQQIAPLGNEKLSRIHFINDQGASFDEHFDDAFRQLFAQDCYAVVAIGGDLPTLPPSHITRSFQLLEQLETENGSFVQAPCQECGVSLVGQTVKTKIDSNGVYYNMDGVPALDAYVQKCREAKIPMISLTPVADVDNMVDFAHTASLIRSIAYSAQYQKDLYVPKNTLKYIDDNQIWIMTPPNAEHDPREALDAKN